MKTFTIWRPSWSKRLFTSSSVNQYPPLPFQKELIALLTDNVTFDRMQAENLIKVIDQTVCEAIEREKGKLMTSEQYDKLMRTYQEGLETHRKEMQQLEQSTAATLTHDHSTLLATLNSTRQQIKEEIGRVESSFKLDLDLERRRRGELVEEMERKRVEVEEFLEKMEGEIRGALGTVAKQAMTAIMGSATIIILGFIIYRLS